ncbi:MULTISPECIES: hypothetical protein [Pseudomonas]|uniref:hypothetical protein n=1 Tax=Pseudomonas TaxID=286 RepID=UPI001032F3CF|nr:hypothetical protein [Pseudomonas sp. Sample_16]
MTAPKELLEALHSAVGEQLLARIASGQATASDFAQAIKFLKDNGIEAIPTAGNSLERLSNSLASQLPFTDPNDSAYH